MAQHTIDPDCRPTSGSSPATELARQVISDEAAALTALARTLDERMQHAAELIAGCTRNGGTVLISGLGKSGLVGQKISATLASLGIPSHFVHPTEAVHGDLGRFRANDLAVCLSHSGETAELVSLAALLAQDGVGIISITRGPASPSDTGTPGTDDTPTPGDLGPATLDRLARVALHTGVHTEAGGAHVIAPTSSTTCTMAIGDALALAAASLLGLGSDDFAKRHPGGLLGGLLRPVTELLRFKVGETITPVRQTHTVRGALRDAESNGRRPGVLLAVDDDGILTGLLTDSDLRRLILNAPEALDAPLADSMTHRPTTLGPDATARDAVSMVRSRRLDEIPVVDRHGRPVGVLDVQDLIALKLVQR